MTKPILNSSQLEILLRMNNGGKSFMMRLPYNDETKKPVDYGLIMKNESAPDAPEGAFYSATELNTNVIDYTLAQFEKGLNRIVAVPYN